MSPRQGAVQRSADEWTELGRQGLLELLEERRAIPWTEAEARISFTKWRDLPPVQPLQLDRARKELLDEGLVHQETTRDNPAVTTLRLVSDPKIEADDQLILESRRMAYRVYQGWTQDSTLCGTQAERVILDSARVAASEGGLWVPPQSVGDVGELGGHVITKGPLDAMAWVLDLSSSKPHPECVLGIESKNLHTWVYQWTSELWELLVKTAEVAVKGVPVVPILVCVRSAYETGQMARDLGFLLCYLGNQIFSPEVDRAEFERVRDEFGLSIIQHAGPHEAVVRFLTKSIRMKPLSPPSEDVPWYRRQRDRFRKVAPLILKYQVLAQGGLAGPKRAETFKSFSAAVPSFADWPLVEGWRTAR